MAKEPLAGMGAITVAADSPAGPVPMHAPRDAMIYQTVSMALRCA